MFFKMFLVIRESGENPERLRRCNGRQYFSLYYASHYKIVGRRKVEGDSKVRISAYNTH